ncbi:hypothetical protein HZA41_02120 [Candidatus Peregrinibacteria bacterium]|nr:hypothetical protein [Candidatus Peregrinibacteria bacterium]
MLVNCLRCGKTISTSRDICPYCKIETTSLAANLIVGDRKQALKERYKGTILSVVLR